MRSMLQVCTHCLPTAAVHTVCLQLLICAAACVRCVHNARVPSVHSSRNALANQLPRAHDVKFRKSAMPVDVSMIANHAC